LVNLNHQPDASVPVYLDHAAATPVLPTIAAMHEQLCQTYFANPHAATELSERARRAVNNAGRQLLSLLGISEQEAEVIWTSGGTEAVNLACIGALRSTNSPAHCGLDPLAHACVLDSCRYAAARVTELAVDTSGRFKLESDNDRALTDCSLVAVCHVNNETGSVHDLPRLRHGLRTVAANALLAVDAIQSFAKLPIPWAEAQIDLLVLSGRKIGGPASVGAIVRRHGVKLTPLFYGGGQQNGLRPGTVDVVGILEFAESARLAFEQRDTELAQVTALNQRLRQELGRWQQWRPRILSPDDASPYILSVVFPGFQGEVLTRILAEHNVIVGSGSACAARSGKPSHVLTAMGCTNADARAVLRISLGHSSTTNDIDTLIRELRNALRDY